MGDLREALQRGMLTEAVAEAITAVKANPTDAESRYRLFALLAFSGDLHRARKQLEALGMGDEQMERAKAVYINLLAAELERRAVFHHGTPPLMPPDPPSHLTLRLAALADISAGRFEDAAAKLELAVEDLPAQNGTINGQAFAGWRDLDDLLGSVLEVFAGGRYMWLPLERIQSLEIKPPSHLLDLLWLPVDLIDVHGASTAVHVPVLYIGSNEGQDPRTATGGITEWYDQGCGILRGRGQRLLGWAGSDGELQELPLLELRTVEQNNPG
ncbi:MAG: avirulence locus temperature-dependent protein secretion protein [Gemmatimonadales bacterium]|nr:MAG: avirulence locus temperature-dependent protein secretion protein [Gemmatimonadales bacterium]